MKNTMTETILEHAPGRLLVVRVFVAFMILVIFVAFATGCATTGDPQAAKEGSTEQEETTASAGQKRVNEKYPGVHIGYIENGYDTIFVYGSEIAHVADTSTSKVVDWTRRPSAKARDDLSIKEVDGIVYKTAEMTDGRDKGNEVSLHMNLKYDPEKKNQPVILFVPGGGFISCQIEDKYEGIHRYLIEHGYAVAIIEYRIIGQGRYIDAVEDVRDAIGWIKSKGRDHGLSGDGVYLMGNSGGGYMAALTACMEPEDIRCVVNYYGLCDIANNKADYEDGAIEAHHSPESSDSQFVYGVYSGKALGEDPEEDAKADPITYINGDEPPFIHFHGDLDLLVSPSQSLHLHDALTKQGIPSTRYLLKGEGHGTEGFRTKESLDLALEFMSRYQ